MLRGMQFGFVLAMVQPAAVAAAPFSHPAER
jgi:hypothetical protein